MRRLSCIFALFLTLNASAITPREKEVEIRTSEGTIVVKLYNDTPRHRDNFLRLVKERIYDSVLFHRVIQEFMIQSGDPDSKRAIPGEIYGEGGLDYQLPPEFVAARYHKKGVLAAARESDQENPERQSSSTQFYIVVGKKFTDDKLDQCEKRISQALKRNFTFTPKVREVYKTIGGTPHLDQQYTVFGEVVKGQEVVDRISKIETDPNDRPKSDVRIWKMKRKRHFLGL